MPYCAHCGVQINEGYLCVECQEMVLRKNTLGRTTPTSSRYQPDPELFSSSRSSERPRKGIIAMAISIFSFILLWPLSIVGIYLGSKSLRDEGNNGYAKAGIIVGIISFIVNLIFVIFFYLFLF
ncbi:MAG: hypothetical protein BAJALOKI1v1_670014 [Promethearchaeota archaeon]|nr:MAG: hypothetical protein BAJALOKI1v1_670014 [Candidatus Lokiarchaeota archaeon]